MSRLWRLGEALAAEAFVFCKCTPIINIDPAGTRLYIGLTCLIDVSNLPMDVELLPCGGRREQRHGQSDFNHFQLHMLIRGLEPGSFVNV